MTDSATNSAYYDVLRRRVRLLLLLDGLERAGIAPVRLRRLHTFAYLSNILAPVWHARVFDGRLLKRRGGPFYPLLQHDLDRLVGLGLVIVTDLGHVLDEDGQWRLDGAFSLNYNLAEYPLNAIRQFPHQQAMRLFLLELAYAVSALTESELDSLPDEDPTYSDPNVSYDSVVDFADWRDLNYSANAAGYFSSVLEHAAPGELLHLFVRHLRRRMNGKQS